MIIGKQMDKVKDGPNWEDDLAGTFDERKSDPNLSTEKAFNLDVTYEGRWQQLSWHVPC